MKRSLGTIALAATVMLLMRNNLNAQGWGGPRISPPKITIPSPGPYQQKILGGAYEGAKVGSKAGGQLGGAGAVLGGVQGAVIGGAYADHQHHSNKIHNFRTPQGNFPLTFWSYGATQGGGYFQKSGNFWIEFKGGRQYAVFQQVALAGNHVLLYDSTRNMEVKLDFNQAFWRTPGRNWNYLFNRAH